MAFLDLELRDRSSRDRSQTDVRNREEGTGELWVREFMPSRLFPDASPCGWREGPEKWELEAGAFGVLA